MLYFVVNQSRAEDNWTTGAIISMFVKNVLAVTLRTRHKAKKERKMRSMNASHMLRRARKPVLRDV